MINYNAQSFRLIEITITHGCKFCKEFLRKMTEITDLTKSYNVSVKFDSNSIAYFGITSSLRLLDSYAEINGCRPKVTLKSLESDFMVSINVEDMPRNIERELLLSCLISRLDSTAFPRIRLDGKDIPMVYSPSQLKEYLIKSSLNML